MRPIETFSNIRNCPFITFENNFNAVNNGHFSRCFEMKIDKKYSRRVAFVVFGFKKNFQEIVRFSAGVMVRFSYPGQILLDFRADHIIWKNYSDYSKLLSFSHDVTQL